MRKTIISLVSILVSVFCHADTYRILKLSPSPVVIGGVNKKVQDTFTDQQEIKWQYDTQGMWVADLTNGGYRYFSKEAFDQKNVKNVYSYLKTNHPSARDGYSWKSVQSAAYDNEKRLALVIGNSNYVNEMSLRNPIADATEISNKLRGLGFDVMVMYDASKKDMEEALQYFRSAAYNQKYGTVLFYYAGHGLQYADKPFLIPSDAKVYTGDHVKENCISGGEIVSYMNETKAETKIAIFDACRSEKTFLRGARADFKMDGLENGVIIFSTKGGYPANDGGSNHSPFAEALLSHMSTPDLGASELLARVISDVKKSTKDFIEPQIPNMTHFSLDHSFYFTKKVETAPATTKTGNSASGKAEVPSKSDSASGTSMPSKRTTSTQTPTDVMYTGKLLDSEGVPLSGAMLFCEKNSAQTTCNAHGEFQITVPQGATITVTDSGQESSFTPTYRESVIQLSSISHHNTSSQDMSSKNEREHDIQSKASNGQLSEIQATHEWVDLGLPSGLLWATCNVGASTPGDYGDYFAWGEIESKESYDWGNYKWCDGKLKKINYLTFPSYFTKYNNDASLGRVDNKSRLDLVDDAARQKWGSAWRMPSKKDFEELRNNCTAEWVLQDGHTGRKFTSKINGNSIFFPANGNGETGGYWSSSLRSDDSYAAWWLVITLDKSYMHYFYRYSRMGIRPVIQKKDLGMTTSSQPLQSINGGDSKSIAEDSNLTGKVMGHEWVDLGLPSGLKWATCNVGATKPTYIGNIYSWGETSPQSNDSNNYKWWHDPQKLTKYNNNSDYGTVDNKIKLELSDDAAYQNWGGTWRMPTIEEFLELNDNCDIIKVKLNGRIGYKLISKQNGKSIIIPVCDEYVNIGRRHGYIEDYWTSSLYTNQPNKAYTVSILCIKGLGYINLSEDLRSIGSLVRPVTE